MATTYVDINARNSRLENDTNNIFEYQLPEAVSLPAGTNISVQNALINLQGITGASIEIDQEYNETICFQYYVSDSTYQAPRGVAGSVGIEYKLYDNLDIHVNQDQEFGSPNFSLPGAIGEDGEFDMGWSENIMPLTVSTKDDNGNYTTYPMCGIVDIKIEKGVYSISKLVTLISDQINQRISLQNERISNIQVDKLNSEYTGLLVNNTTNRFVKVEGFKKAAGDAALAPKRDWVEYHNADPGYVDGNWWTMNSQPGGDVPMRRALRVTDTGIPTAVAVTCQQNELIRRAIVEQKIDGSADQDLLWTNFVPYYKPAKTKNPDGKYNIVFNEPIGSAKLNSDLSANKILYNIFVQGMGVGTTGFNINYDSVRSAFSIQKCHETRREQSHDRYGNTLSAPGAGVSFVKIPCHQAQGDAGDTGTGAEPMTVEQLSTIKTLVQRYSGVCIYNWAYKTCQEKGNPYIDPEGQPGLAEFQNFDEFFNDEADAVSAWEGTIWKRIGFTYSDLQSKNAFTEQKFFGNDIERSPGFTTRNQIGSSAMPYISTLYNPLAEAGSKQAAPAGGSVALPSVDALHAFNLLSYNVPQYRFTNSTKAGAQPPTVAQYQSSFYTAAVMFPIQTKELDVVASELPILTENGYLYILSNLVDQNDIVKFKDNVGLLDQLPKSNLSNQDFISDRTQITHTLANEKILNSIRIQILNPDLTNVTLQANSSILIKITRPMEKQTVLLNNISNSMKENALQAQVQKEAQAAQAASKKKAKTKVKKA